MIGELPSWSAALVPLQAGKYRPGDTVIGPDDLGRVFDNKAEAGLILLYWHKTPEIASAIHASRVRLWPSTAHRARLNEEGW